MNRNNRGRLQNTTGTKYRFHVKLSKHDDCDVSTEQDSIIHWNNSDPPIHIVAFGIFSPQNSDEARRQSASEKDQASIRRGRSPTDERNGQRRHIESVTTFARRRAIDFLSSSWVYDISPRFDTTRNLSACHACLSRTRRPASLLRAPARICLSKRTLGGCCLDITEQRKRHTARKLVFIRKALKVFLFIQESLHRNHFK